MNILRDFRRIYQRAAGNGREARLFGTRTQAKAEAALKKYALDASACVFYFEIPLTGEPRMDLLLQYNCERIKLPLDFCSREEREENPAMERSYWPFFEACAADSSLARYLVGFSFDLSEDREAPGIYLLPPLDLPNANYVPAMFERLGAKERLPKIMEAFADAPLGLTPYYAGFMVSRPGAPARLGFCLAREKWRQWRNDRSLLKKELSRSYRRPIPGEMADQIYLMTQKGYVWDLQFDMFPDGSFARALGVSVRDETEDTSPENVADFLGRNRQADLLRLLKSWGLADARAELLEDLCAAVKRNVVEGEEMRTVVDFVSRGSCKVRFKNEEAYLAKSYIHGRTQYL